MIRIQNLSLVPGEPERRLRAQAAKTLRLGESEIGELKILRKSLDARKKTEIRFVYTVAVSVPDETRLLRRFGGKNVDAYKPFVYEIPNASASTRPVVVGFGPAGMFAALVLARAGLRPIVLERGPDADVRRAAVEHYRKTGMLDVRANVQFGEGGAGTFSDGKLHTGTHDVRVAWVLERFAEFGADESVVYSAAPHVGTDVLIRVVKNLREEILRLGGEVRFLSCFTGFRSKNGALCAVLAETDAGPVTIPCESMILAIGHSARDTFEQLHAAGLPMEPKPFSMGVRIEHRQRDVDRAQYGETDLPLPPASYKLNCTLPDGSSVYTFCMCPGGYVMAAASEEGGVVTNGMSYSGRGGENANAALLVTLHPEDFPEKDVLGGMRWQREIERRAFAYGGENALAPAQLAGDFLEHRPSTGPQSVLPTYLPGVVWGDLREVLPAKITDPLAAALPVFARRIACFGDPDAVLTAPETRSSSPVRILRGADLCSCISGLYPCGEGAGYAGGITSAAVDGMRCAEKIIEKYCR